MLFPFIVGSFASFVMQQGDSAHGPSPRPSPSAAAVVGAPGSLSLAGPAVVRRAPADQAPAGSSGDPRNAPSVMLAGAPAGSAAVGNDILAAMRVGAARPRRALSFAPARARAVSPSTLAPRLADSVVVEKARRRLTLYLAGQPIHRYQIALGRNPVGDKVQKGDDRTPEGLFRIDWRNRQSRYFLSLHISYPDIRHQERAARLGLDPGGDIMIHGLPPRFADYGRDHLQWDWTNGCVAVSNEEMEELWRAVPDGTPIEIRP